MVKFNRADDGTTVSAEKYNDLLEAAKQAIQVACDTNGAYRMQTIEQNLSDDWYTRDFNNVIGKLYKRLIG
jgi:pyruvate-formate lyase-activating enzyme